MKNEETKTDKAKVALSMPQSAYGRLIHDWKHDRQKVIDHFKAAGFDILDILPHDKKC